VCELAADREVLVSSTVKDLVVGSALAFEDRGVHQLRGVPGEWRLYALNGESRRATDSAERAAAGLEGAR
jgi:class 3 adenylate cyclase